MTTLTVGPSGQYATIQAAIDAAQAGDTIQIAAGPYNESLAIDKELTIQGANAGISGTSTRGAETVLTWASGDMATITTTAPVTFDGLRFVANTDVITTHTQNSNITFTNSTFDIQSGGTGGNAFYLSEPEHFTFTNNLVDAHGYASAFFQPVGDPDDPTHSTVTFTGNTFVGHPTAYIDGDDNVVPLILNFSDVNGTVTGNTFSNVDIGVLLGNGTGPLDISGNTFENMHREPGQTGGGFAAGVVFYTPGADLGPITITNNTFMDADAGIRTSTSGAPSPTIEGLPIAIEGNTFANVEHPGWQPAGGVLHLTNSTVDGVVIASEFVGGGTTDDTIASTAANDVVSGGGGTDTVTYSGMLTAANIASVADADPMTDGNQPGWQVSAGAEGTDKLTSVEKIDGAGTANILLVGNGGYATIQDAITAAQAGDTILIAAGSYAGFNANVAGVNIVADGQVVIQGQLLSELGVPPGTPLNDFLEQNHPNYTASTGVTVSADDVTISGLTITGFSVGLNLGTSDGVTLNGNTFINNVTGLNKPTAAQVTDLTMNENTFTQGIHGMTIQAAQDGSGAFDGITMNNNTFSHLSEKGMYFEQLSNASLTGNSFDDVGNYGRVAPPFGPAAQNGEFGQAIDVNLKYETYANVTFTNTVITNSGHSDRDGAGSPGTFGAAVGVKIRDDGPSYNAHPADFTGQIVFNGLSIDGTSTGVRVGEPSKNNGGPDVVLQNVAIANATVTDLANVTDPVSGGTTSAVLAAGQIAFDASTSQAPAHITGNDLANAIAGGSASDTLSGLGGDDRLIGGGGIDAAVYTGSINASMVTGDGSGHFLVATGGSEGTDTLSGIEKIDGAGTANILLVGNGGYATIQDAITAAQAGDTVLIANGTYTLGSTLNVDKAITLQGESEAGVTLDFHSVSGGYGILLTGDGASLSQLTVIGPAGGAGSGDYGIKVQPGTGQTSLSGITIDHVTVQGSLRSEIDLNGVHNSILSNITANGQNTAGVGIALTDSTGITLQNIATSGNNWGSIALYTTGIYFTPGTGDITFQGTYTHGESIGIFSQDESAVADLGAVTFPPSFTSDGDGVYKVTNDTFRGTPQSPADSNTFTFFFGSEAEATAFALGLPSANRSVIEGPDGHLLVEAGMSVQAAIDAAHNGDTIDVFPGTYIEQTQYQGGSQIGLVIDKSVTIQGVDATGHAITDANNVAATIVSGAQSWWGTNFFVTAPNVTISGLDLKAADGSFYNQGDEVNKAIEVIADNFTLQHSVVRGPDGHDVASTVYINDGAVPNVLTGWVSSIGTFHVTDNILKGDFVVTNGPGYGRPSVDFEVTGNDFVRNPGSSPDYNWGIIITGKMEGVPWRLAPVVAPTVTGNTFADDYTTDRILFIRDDSPANIPDRTYVDAFLANNNVGTYAFAAEPAGDPRLVQISATNPYGAGPINSNGFVVHKLAGAASADAISGDNLIVQSGAGHDVETIITDNLTVQALSGSANLDLDLGGSVTTLKLADYDPINHLGANVDVTGNSFVNAITGNSGNNTLNGGGGDDLLTGGRGNDTLIGGGEVDTALYTGAINASMLTDDGSGHFILATGGSEGTDTLSGIEKIDGAGAGSILLVGNGSTYATIQDAISAAGADDTVFAPVGSGTILSSVTIPDGVIIDTLPGATVVSAIIGDGGTININGGTVISATVSSGGQELVSSGGVDSGATITDGGTQVVFDGGIVISPTVDDGGTINVSGGTVTGAVVNSGGQELVSSGGVDSGATITDGGTQIIFAGGSAVSVVVTDPGLEIVSFGGTVTSALVSGGVQNVFGTAINTLVESGAAAFLGAQIVESSGVASGTVLSAGGIAYVLGSAFVTQLAGGVDFVYGFESGTIVSGGLQLVVSGGLANGTVVSAGGTQAVTEGGTISSTQIAGGVEYVYGSAFATQITGGYAYVVGSASNTTIFGGVDFDYGFESGTIVSGGLQLVVSGGLANGTVVSAGGTQAVALGGTISGTQLAGGVEYVLGSAFATQLAGGVDFVYGFESGTIVSGGLQLVVSGGLANGTVVSAGGTQAVTEGGTISSTQIAGGVEYVYGSAFATQLTGGYAYVLGSASNMTIFGGVDFDYGFESGTIVSGGLQLVVSGGLANGTVVSAGGTQAVALGGTISGTQIAGVEYLYGWAFNTMIMSGGTQAVEQGGIASGTVVSAGGVEYVASGGVATGTVIDGGTLEVANGASTGAAPISFAASAGGMLLLDDSIHFGGLVAGFGLEDSIDLRDIAFISGSTSANFVQTNATSGTLTVTNGTNTANITLLGQYVAGNFQVQNDGHGAILVTDPPANRDEMLSLPQHA